MATINIDLKTIINQELSTEVIFELLDVATTGTSLVPRQKTDVKTNSSGIASIELVSGNYSLYIFNKRLPKNIAVGTDPSYNLVDIYGVDPVSGGGGGNTDLSYVAAPAKGTVTSSTGNNATILAADGTNAGLFLPAEKAKLAGIESGAEVNNISDQNVTNLTNGNNTTLHFHNSDRSRANHTGTQAISTVSGLEEALAQKIESIQAGTNIEVDDTDPLNPVVSAVNDAQPFSTKKIIRTVADWGMPVGDLLTLEVNTNYILDFRGPQFLPFTFEVPAGGNVYITSGLGSNSTLVNTVATRALFTGGDSSSLILRDLSLADSVGQELFNLDAGYSLADPANVKGIYLPTNCTFIGLHPNSRVGTFSNFYGWISRDVIFTGFADGIKFAGNIYAIQVNTLNIGLLGANATILSFESDVILAEAFLLCFSPIPLTEATQRVLSVKTGAIIGNSNIRIIACGLSGIGEFFDNVPSGVRDNRVVSLGNVNIPPSTVFSQYSWEDNVDTTVLNQNAIVKIAGSTTLGNPEDSNAFSRFTNLNTDPTPVALNNYLRYTGAAEVNLAVTINLTLQPTSNNSSVKVFLYKNAVTQNAGGLTDVLVSGSIVAKTPSQGLDSANQQYSVNLGGNIGLSEGDTFSLFVQNTSNNGDVLCVGGTLYTETVVST